MRRGATLALLLGSAGAAHASPFDLFGFGARATSMGGAHAAEADDYSGTYYNPAALTRHKTPHVGVGVNVLVPNLSIGVKSDHAQVTTREPENNVGVNLGLLFPLGGLIKDRIALAVGVYLPTVQVTRIESLDAETPHFYRLGALADKLVVAVGLAGELHEAVSIGIGMQVLGSLDGQADVELDILTGRFLRKDLKVDVQAATALTAGVHVRASKTLRFGFSFRDALDLAYDITTGILIKDVGQLDARVYGSSLYTPQQFTLGAAADLGDWTATVDLVWARWSQAPDPSARIEITLDGAPLGFGAATAEAAPVDLGAVDTLSPRVGVEWRASPAWSIRGGYALQPTPLPAQTGYTNYVDASLHQVAAGFAYRFADPFAMHDAPITLEITSQATLFPERQMTKADPNDAVGSYSADGTVWNTSLSFRHDFY